MTKLKPNRALGPADLKRQHHPKWPSNLVPGSTPSPGGRREGAAGATVFLLGIRLAPVQPSQPLLLLLELVAQAADLSVHHDHLRAPGVGWGVTEIVGRLGGIPVNQKAPNSRLALVNGQFHTENDPKPVLGLQNGPETAQRNQKRCRIRGSGGQRGFLGEQGSGGFPEGSVGHRGPPRVGWVSGGSWRIWGSAGAPRAGGATSSFISSTCSMDSSHFRSDNLSSSSSW